jgi:starch-binding outer membrane protein, SusD/RagB family
MNSSRSKIYAMLGAALLLGATGCSNLDDQVLGGLSSTSSKPDGVAIDPASSLQGVYTALNGFTGQDNTYAMEEHSSDEMQGPTRGTDWDDFGTWRKLHQHTWTPDHNQVTGAWDQLNSGAFKATQTLSVSSASTQIKAEASFLRAYFTFFIVDLYGQVPSRAVTDAADANPKVLSRDAATNGMITDLRYAYNNLAATTSTGIASKEAAAGMLAKVYLNRAVFKQTGAGPFTFAKADMDSTIFFANVVQSSPKYALAAKGKYFDNFHWDNTARSKEIMFAILNSSAAQPGNVRARYYMGLHYNQYVSGWNGFTTLADFYNSFDAKDERRGGPLPELTDSTGLNAGFLVGQQLDRKKAPLKDRSGNPLAFTSNVNLAYAQEAEGIRVIKYLPQPGVIDAPSNDYILLRYADVLLMKAEAVFRGGTDPKGETAAVIINNLRTVRGAATKATIAEADILAERGFELYYEGWRRNDQIRFGTFLNPVQNRPTKSPATAVLYPIPQRAIDSNPNLKQNDGY